MKIRRGEKDMGGRERKLGLEGENEERQTLSCKEGETNESFEFVYSVDKEGQMKGNELLNVVSSFFVFFNFKFERCYLGPIY